MNTLHEQQRNFARFIVADDEQQVDVDAVNLKSSACHQFKATQRLQVYRNNYLISFREALAGVYPVVFKLVGEEFFQYVAREYVQHYPSRTGNLHDFGDEFPSFLQSCSELAALPYLPDVARLEWAHHHVFHTAEEPVLNLAALAGLNDEQMAGLTFQVSSSCVCLQSDFPILHIWQVNQDEQEASAEIEEVSLDEGGVQCVVLRHGQDIEFHPLSAGVFALLDSLAGNKTFAQACELALGAEAECDITASLQFLVEQKILSGFFVGHSN